MKSDESKLIDGMKELLKKCDDKLRELKRLSCARGDGSPLAERGRRTPQMKR